MKKYKLTEYTLLNIVELGAKRYKDLVALERYKSDLGRLTYNQLYEYSKRVAAHLIDNGIQKNDKVAIFAESDPYWGLAYFGIIMAGAIAVPILPDFSSVELSNILAHSEVKGIFISNNKLYEKAENYLNENKILVYRCFDMFFIENALNLKNFDQSAGFDIKNYKVDRKHESEFEKRRVKEDDLASIIYTSGTTGTSKGVMLTHKNIATNIDTASVSYVKINKGDRMLSILPQSHTYEFSFGFGLALTCGCKTTYLGKPPVASLLMPALKEIRPHIMLSVPLLIEKVYRMAVASQINKKPKLKKLYNGRFTHNFVCKLIGKKLKASFGGKLKFFGIGGAPLDTEVERFLIDAKFPVAFGYGLTETSPLVAGVGPKKVAFGVVGLPVENVEVKIDNPNSDGIGEVLVKGPNVMKGYYKAPDLTNEVFTKDGYFKTGDLGFLDKKGRLGLRGRIKTLILGPSGENIYPEPIEDLINCEEYVEESLVFKNDRGLGALIKIDIALLAKNLKIDIVDAKDASVKYLAQIRSNVNKKLNSYSKIDDVELTEEPLKRTPTLKIKRYLYEKFNKKKDVD